MNLVEINRAEGGLMHGCPQVTPYVGEAVKIFGDVNRKKHEVDVAGMEFLPAEQPEVGGSAVIEAIANPASASAQVRESFVRADGYRIRINSKTDLKFVPPLQRLADVRAGDWIDYAGRLNAAGVLVAFRARIGLDIIGKREEKRRAKTEFDPSVTPADKQGRWSMAFEGIDPAKFMPVGDASMQAHINEIGNRLIPAYQRDLPDSDPQKIHFRFQLIESKWLRFPLPLASGIILVPHRLVESVQNDAQLAEILADGVAHVIEREAYSWSETAGKVRATGTAVAIAGSAVPVVGLAGEVVMISADDETEWFPQERSGRVSLGLLYGAGYDIDQAPIAWWLLASKDPKPIAEIRLPDHAAYLYRILGETWHNPAANATLMH